MSRDWKSTQTHTSLCGGNIILQSPVPWPSYCHVKPVFSELIVEQILYWSSNIYYSVEFEPHATMLEQKGEGYVVASLGEDSGYVPYTSFSARKSYLEKNKAVVQAFTNALQKGMDFVQSHTPKEIAEAIAPQFPETDMETLTAIVERYYDQDTWKDNLIFEEDAFDLLQNILDDSGVLKERVPYADLVTKEFAEEAAK